MKDNLIKKAYISAFDIEDKYLKDLIVINTKCLVDDNIQRRVYIDNKRLRDELIYYKFYGERPNYNNILNLLLPVIISNTNIKKSEDEVLELIQKYVKYFKKEEYLFEYILSSVLYNSIIHNIIEDNTIEYKDLLQKIKEQIIGFTISLDKASTIKFHMARINAIQQIDKYIDLKVQDYDDEKILGSLLNILYDIYIEDREVKDFGSKSIKKSILSILGDDENHNIDNIDFILSMSEYIVKLRQYKINKKVYDKNSDPRYLINLNEGDTYNDPIFNQIKIISKNFNNNILNINIKSKSGLYVLKFIKSSSVVSVKKQISLTILFLRSIKSSRPVFSLVYSNAFKISNKSLFDKALIDTWSINSIKNSFSNLYNYNTNILQNICKNLLLKNI